MFDARLGTATSALKTLLTVMILALAGVAGGALADASFTTPDLVAAEACESDECNEDCNWFGCDEECIDNPGQATSCSMAGEDCTTGGC